MENNILNPETSHEHWDQEYQDPVVIDDEPKLAGNVISDDEIELLIAENEADTKNEIPIPTPLLQQTENESEEPGAETETGKKDEEINLEELFPPEIAAEIMDMILATGCEMAGAALKIPEQKDQYNATPKQKKLLVKVLKIFLQSKQLKGSPTGILIISLLSIYGLNFGSVWATEKMIRKREQDARKKAYFDIMNGPEGEKIRKQAEEIAYRRMMQNQGQQNEEMQNRDPLFNTGAFQEQKAKGGRPRGSKDSYKREIKK